MRFFLTTCIALSLAWTSAGQTVSQLYQGRVAVASQAQQERKQALSTALAQVLVRVSGHSQVLQNPAVQALLADTARVQRLLEQFGYDEYQGELADLNFDFLPLFSQTRVDEFLRTQCLPLWRANRPQLLVMASFDEQRQRKLLHPNDDGWQQLLLAAGRRGLPVTMPLYDLQDQGQISVAAVAGLFASELTATLQRYQPDSLLLGRIEQSNTGELLAHWQLTSLGKNYIFSGEYIDQQQLYGEVMDWATDLLAQQYAIACNQRGSQAAVLLQVDNVNSIKNYAELNRYLAELDVVQNVSLYKMDQTTAFYSLQMSGEFRHFNQAVALDRRMSLSAQPAWTNNPEQRPQLQLQYRWLR